MNPTRRLALVIGHSSLVLSSAALLAAADDALRPIAFQNGINQQSLGTETAELARAIDELIDELQRNGFPVQSLSGLSELASQLNALGGTEMTAIATRLRRLGENAKTDPRATATEAYLAQQAIETRLKSLARQISIQQLREEAARRLEALIARQIAVQRETRSIATATADAERQRLLESDQAGIGEDLGSFFQTGENLLSRLRETDSPAAPSAPSADTPGAAGNTFSERINGAYLNTLSTEALDHVKGKRFPEGYARQGALVVELRKILQGILSSLPKEQRLANALQEVSALRQQEEARAKTRTSTEESKQAAAEQAQKLADQVAALSPEAAAALKEAAKEVLLATVEPPPPSPSDPTTPPDGETTPPPAKDPNTEPQQTASKGTPETSSGEQQAATSPASGTSRESGNEPGAEPPSKASTQTAGTQPPESSSGEQQAGAPQPGEESKAQSAAAESLAAAEAALQKALAQAQSQAQAAQGKSQPGQPNSPQGQQQANAQQSGLQQGEQQQQPQGLHNSQMVQDGGQSSAGGFGNAQNQITGRGPSTADPAQVVGALRREEREAFTALQNERYPAEYSAWVQQYWRNLAQDQ